MKVTSGEFLKHFGRYHDAARLEPVTITKHGRDSVVMLSADEYQRLKRRDRQVLRVEQLDEGFLKELESADVPAEHNHLDDELEDWTP